MEWNPFWTRITILMQRRFHDIFQFKIINPGLGMILTLATFLFSFAVNFDKKKISIFFSRISNCQNAYYTALYGLIQSE